MVQLRSDPDLQPVVATIGLTKVFKDFWMRDQVRAVDQLDMEIRPGQVFGLIGPNGSGKSTTIKLILGLLHKTRGRIAVFGKPPTDVLVKNRIGFLPEESYLYQFLNSRETLDFYGKLFGLPRRVRQRRIDELLEMVGLEAVQFRPVGQFSKGMQRRIGIAQALINDPDFLILDEPTSGLDPIGIRQVKDLILELSKRGKTILLSSHVLPDVEDVCDYMVILYGGKKRAEGTSSDLLTAHDRTIIEFEALSDQEAQQISQRTQREHGKQVLRIEPARQSLESLFISIVEKAQAEHVLTHGVGAGGPTASFLRDDHHDTAPAQGEHLIANLLADDDQAEGASSIPGPADGSAPADAPTEGRDDHKPGDDVLESLLAGNNERTRDDSPPTPEEVQSEAAKARPASDQATRSDVDSAVIDSLLGSENQETDKSP